MRRFTINDKVRTVLERPEMQKYLNIFASEAILSSVTEEYWDRTFSELGQELTMPWGAPFIPEMLLDAAERVEELVEDHRFEFLPLWHDAPEGFIPDLRKNSKDSVCLMRLRTGRDSGESRTEVRPAALICPGGGYEFLSIQNEGIDIAEYLEQKGYAAYVVLYRVAPNRYPEPQKDLALAIKFVRANAERFHIDPDRVLITGASAAGHLCASQSTYTDEIDRCLMADLEAERPELAERFRGIPSKADAVCLIYPVIDFTQFAHEPSFQALGGGDERLRDKLSIQKHVTADFPPAFLWTCRDDELVPYQNTELMAAALKENGVHSCVHIYPQGGHGCGLAAGTSAEGWIDECLAFLKN